MNEENLSKSLSKAGTGLIGWVLDHDTAAAGYSGIGFSGLHGK